MTTTPSDPDPAIFRTRPASLRRRLALAVAGCLACIAMVARAQSSATTPARAIDEGLRRQEERAQELRQRTEPRSDVLAPHPSAAAAATLPAEQPCFTIKAVGLSGPDAAHFFWLADSALPYLRQCAGVAGLRQIAAALDARLIELGYVTSRVTLPEQNLGDGVLSIRLHVGRVAQLAMFSSGMPDSGWGTGAMHSR